MKYFTRDELECKCGCGDLIIDYQFIRKIEELREELDFPFYVNSYYRCKRHNARSGGAKDSYHLVGRAMDVRARGLKARLLIKNSDNFGLTGVGVYPTFIHLDDGENDINKKIIRPNFWVGR